MDTTRTEILIGKNGVEKLKAAHIAVFGAGGVGSYAIEALARSGVGQITVIDGDVVDPSNINRQLIALSETVGMSKTEAAKERILSINPECKVNAVQMFYSQENVIDLSGFDYIIDAIDSLRSKVFLIKSALECNVKIISAMGTGNRLDPTKLKICDIYETSGCPFARRVRGECRKAGIVSLRVVCSDEEALEGGKDGTVGSMTFVPGTAGLILAGEVISDIIKK